MIRAFLVIVIQMFITSSFIFLREVDDESVYIVKKLTPPIKIDAVWNKPQWGNIAPIEIRNHMGELSSFTPTVLAKMMYDKKNIYVIFHVQDKFVRCITKEIDGKVWGDSCVELFFSPDPNLPERYFNLEVNCGGTPLFHYNIIPRKEVKNLDIKDIRKVEIAHSLPQIIDPEIVEPVTWTIEYRIPIKILKKYSNVASPKPGIIWRANFYKIADLTSNPHYLTWSFVNQKEPDFHLPQFFGKLKFE